jgi:hypothetical protein
MTWDEAMQFYPAAKAMAQTFSYKASDPEIVEDLTQELMVFLVEKVDTSRAKGSVKGYVAGALWKGCMKKLFQGRELRRRKVETSLDEMFYHNPNLDIVRSRGRVHVVNHDNNKRTRQTDA